MAEPVRDPDPVPAAAGVATPTDTLYCSFCFQSQHDVKMLIAGPAAVFICDECVALCNQWIARTPPPAGSRPVAVEDLPTERLIARLGPIEQTVQGRAS